jgi:hypothetical protein
MMSKDIRTMLAGWGYWDVTGYPYGGNFKRLEADTEVCVLGPAGKYPTRESKVIFPNGDKGIVDNRSFSIEAA